MTENEITKHDQVLMGLVVSLQAGAMQQLGKLADPASGEVVRDLVSARATIDILEMLKAKCRTDTPAAVLRILDTAVMELQMNYVDEMKKESSGKQEPAAAEPDADSAAEGDEAGPRAEPEADSSAADELEPEEG